MGKMRIIFHESSMVKEWHTLW